MTNTDNSATTSNQHGKTIPWRRIANIAGLVLLVAIVVPFVVFAVPQVVGADHSYVVLSGSMEPTMSPGDVIIVNSVAASNIEENDIITYGGESEGSPTTHRVIEVVEQDGTTAFRTQGDANEDPDASLVTPNQLQGKVMSVGGYPLVVPLIGYVVNFAGTQSGFVLFFAIPVSLLVLNEVWDIVTSARSGPDGASDRNAESSTVEASAASASGSDAVKSSKTAPDRADDGIAEPAATDTNVATTPETPDESDAGITFTAAELQLGLAINAVFLIYSVWVAYEMVETWSLGVAGAVGASFLLLSGLYVLGSGGNTTGDPESDGTATSSGPGSDWKPTQASADTATADREDSNATRSEEPDPDAEVDTPDDAAPQQPNADVEPSSAADGGHLDSTRVSTDTGEDRRATPPESDEGDAVGSTNGHGGEEHE